LPDYLAKVGALSPVACRAVDGIDSIASVPTWREPSVAPRDRSAIATAGDRAGMSRTERGTRIAGYERLTIGVPWHSARAQIVQCCTPSQYQASSSRMTCRSSSRSAEGCGG